jgi:hypothetical protein
MRHVVGPRPVGDCRVVFPVLARVRREAAQAGGVVEQIDLSDRYEIGAGSQT